MFSELSEVQRETKSWWWTLVYCVPVATGSSPALAWLQLKRSLSFNRIVQSTKGPQRTTRWARRSAPWSRRPAWSPSRLSSWPPPTWSWTTFIQCQVLMPQSAANFLDLRTTLKLSNLPGQWTNYKSFVQLAQHFSGKRPALLGSQFLGSYRPLRHISYS